MATQETRGASVSSSTGQAATTTAGGLRDAPRRHRVPLAPRVSEWARNSLFVVPTTYAIGGVVLGVLGLTVDEHVSSDLSIPLVVASTPDSARSVLSTVASATMTFAGIAISITLVVLQMASSQYSPRVVHGVFRDRSNKRTIGLVVGTFTYCLVVLRSVHGPLDSGGDPTVPTLSVSAAVVLGVVTVLAIVGFIDHNARWMDVSHVLQELTDLVRRRSAERWWPEHDDHPDPARPTEPARPVRSEDDGWIQHVDVERLLTLVPPDGTVQLVATPGCYIGRGDPLVRIWPPRTDEQLEEATGAVVASIVVGPRRTVTQDPSYALRQMADIGLKALSPGINDPTTAQEAVLHLGEALRASLDAGLAPRALATEHGGRLLMDNPTAADLVDLAFGEMRRAAAEHPVVTSRLLEVITRVEAGLGDGADDLAAGAALRRQAELAVDDAERAGVTGPDLEELRRHLVRSAP